MGTCLQDVLDNGVWRGMKTRLIVFAGTAGTALLTLYILLNDSPNQRQPTFETTTEWPSDYVPPDKSFVQMSVRERAAYVRQRCADTNQWKHFTTFVTSRSVAPELLIEDKFNITVCFNRKVASSNAKRIFYTLQNRQYVVNINDIPTHVVRHMTASVNVSVEDINTSGNIKVLFVRDPLERLLSAYRIDKGFKDIRSHWNLTFKEYLQAIVLHGSEWTNHHLISYFDHCLPCDVDYDYVATTETFNSDMSLILRQIHAEFVELPIPNCTGYEKNSRVEMAKYLTDVSPRLLEFIFDKYRMDYYMFGYEHPKHWLQ